MTINHGSHCGYGIMIIKLESGITLKINEDEELTIVDQHTEFRLSLSPEGDTHPDYAPGHLLSNGYRADHSSHCG